MTSWYSKKYGGLSEHDRLLAQKIEKFKGLGKTIKFKLKTRNVFGKLCRKIEKV